MQNTAQTFLRNASWSSRANAELLGAEGAYSLNWIGWIWWSSVSSSGTAVDRAVVGEALVHPFPLGWGAALRLMLLTLQGQGCPAREGEPGAKVCLSESAGSPAVSHTTSLSPVRRG